MTHMFELSERIGCVMTGMMGKEHDLKFPVLHSLYMGNSQVVPDLCYFRSAAIASNCFDTSIHSPKKKKVICFPKWPMQLPEKSKLHAKTFLSTVN